MRISSLKKKTGLLSYYKRSGDFHLSKIFHRKIPAIELNTNQTGRLIFNGKGRPNNFILYTFIHIQQERVGQKRPVS